MNKLYSAALFVLSCALSCASYAAPQVGWYWNPNESGRGFFIESQNGITFIGAYLYDTDGRATWLVAGGPNADPYNFTGQLYYKTQGQTLFGSYVAPGNAVIVGNIAVHFTDDTHATLTWPGGTVAIERQIFGGADTELLKPYSGWWWNPAESGSGYSVELQGTNLFIVGFMYDATGQPVWYYSAGPMTSENTYSGPVLQFANGQTLTGSYKPPGTPTTVATVDITFSRPDRATLKFSGLSSTNAQRVMIKADRTEEITRQFRDSFVPFFYYYVGGVTVNSTGSIPFNGLFGADGTFNLVGAKMDWQLNSEADSSELPGLKSATYILLGADFTLTKTVVSKVLDPEIGLITCTATGTGSKHIGYPLTARSNIKVSNSRAYTVNINVEGDQIPLTGSLVCTGPGGGALPYTPPPFPTPQLVASGTGTAVGTAGISSILADKFPTRTFSFPLVSVTLSGDYEFNGSDDCQVLEACPP